MSRPADLTPLAVLAARHPHGTRVRYMCGCGCMLCRAANSRYKTERDRAQKNGDWNGLVTAAPARRHIEALSRAGVGRRAISAACDVGNSVISQIRNGHKIQICARTARRILSVTRDAIADGALVPAGPAWRKIRALLGEGFTRCEIARRIRRNPRSLSLQLGQNFLTARNASRVERLYRQAMQ